MTGQLHIYSRGLTAQHNQEAEVVLKAQTPTVANAALLYIINIAPTGGAQMACAVAHSAARNTPKVAKGVMKV